jgi:hypothetical protein
VPESSSNPATKPDQPAERLKYLDANEPQLIQVIEPSDQVDSKFVQVKVVEVQNPKLHNVTFKVEYKTSSNETVFLGSFSLYPPNNPGRFIVATHGKVKGEGSIVLSLVVPEEFKAGDILRIGVKRMTFVKQ